MRLPKFRYFAVAGAAIGLAIPALSLLYIYAFAGIGSLWTLLVWPTSIMLMGPEVGPDAPGRGTLCLSIALNAFLYAVLFVLPWCLAWVFLRWRASLRNGTTI
jgi:hypothetical protein